MVNWIYSGNREPAPHLVEELLNSPPAEVSIDIETPSLKDKRIIGVGIGVSRTDGFYFPNPMHCADGDPDLFYRLLENILGNPSILKVFHNAAYDVPELEEIGLDAPQIWDTSSAAHYLGLATKRRPATLQNLAADVLEWKIDSIKDVLPARRTMLDLPIEVTAKKCLMDVRVTIALKEKFLQYLPPAFSKEMELLPILIRMGRRGIAVDHQYRLELVAKYQAEIDYYRGLCDAEGFNPASPDQVGYMLTMRGNFLPSKKGRFLTDEESLTGIPDPLAAVILNFRKAAKLKGTYLDPWSLADRAYTRYHLHTGTGRLASVDRNLQNVPPDLRGCLVPDDNPTPVFTDWDYKQQELRALAYLSGDKRLQAALDTGDPHQYTADFIGITRRVAKNVAYAMIYGGDDATLAATAGIKDRNLAHKLRDDWINLFPKAWKHLQWLGDQGLKDGYVLTVGGRKLYLPDIEDEGPEGIRRKAMNYPMQGSGAENIKESILILHKAGYTPAITVHDSNATNNYITKEELLSLGIENTAPYHIPIEVKWSQRWS